MLRKFNIFGRGVETHKR